ncbi:MAG: hypothetical protein PWP24_993, partial [Clostridiales bacterium]|nr:hypothetical protein [Clostridiales bacterium]
MKKDIDKVRWNVYLKNLKQNQIPIDYYSIAKELYSENIIVQTSLCVSGPMLISYGLWIINEARRKGLEKLYFVARDGLIMNKIVCYFAEKMNLDIQCKYLYCSRYALILPVYSVNKELGLNLIFSGGSRVSLNTIFKRIGLTLEQQKEIRKSIEYSEEQSNVSLNNVGISEIKNKLLRNKTFTDMLETLSKQSYEDIIQYFEQEGLLDNAVYLVDSGWRGNIQNNISVILRSLNPMIKVEGFYFGLERMYKNQKYNCFYFSPQKKLFRVIHFNYNIFESFCSAEHGMTVGYKKNSDTIEPVLKDKFIREDFIQIQEKLIFEMMKRMEIQKVSPVPDSETLVKGFQKNLNLFMNNPTKTEVSYWGSIAYCEDESESYFVRLAEDIPKNQRVHYLIFRRLYDRVLTNKSKRIMSESFWIKG